MGTGVHKGKRMACHFYHFTLSKESLKEDMKDESKVISWLLHSSSFPCSLVVRMKEMRFCVCV